jgi:hypothetical protein
MPEPPIPEAAYADPSNNPGVTHMPINTETDPATLIDQQAIDDAVRKLSTLRQRHTEAVAAVPQAAHALDAATRQHIAAITTGGDAAVTKRAVLDAQADHQLALEVVDALAAEAARLQVEELPRVQAEAHAQLVRYALQETAACAVERDALEAAHGRNDDRHRDALRMLTTASASGHAAARAYVGGGLRPTEREPTASRSVAAEQALQGELVI